MKRALLVALLAVAMVPAAPAQSSSDAVVRVFEPGGMEADTVRAVTEAVAAQRARAAFFHSGTIRLLEVRRGDEVIQSAPAGMAYPMSSIAFDPVEAAPLFDPALTRVLSLGLIAMGETSAGLRGAQVGDVVEVRGWDDRLYEFRIGFIADDHEVGYAELIFSSQDAEAIGFERVSSARIWGYQDEDHLNVLVRHGTDGLLRVTSPGDQASPDDVLPSALLKAELGEFAYRPTGRGDWIQIDPAWVEENIVFINHRITGPFPCHRVVAPYVELALDQMQEMGIGGLVDQADFQAAGGCYVPRLIRGGDKGGAISRHAYGAAIDINPSDNTYGGRVSMDIRIVRIFRDLGFAWGGGWTFTDGMHFEFTRPVVAGESAT